MDFIGWNFKSAYFWDSRKGIQIPSIDFISHDELIQPASYIQIYFDKKYFSEEIHNILKDALLEINCDCNNQDIVRW